MAALSDFENAEVTEREALFLVALHTEEADFYLACRNNQIDISKRDPLYRSGCMQTKQDWLDLANKSEQSRKHHRERARHWKKYIKSLHSEINHGISK